jgi:hypothetical protein
LLHGRHSVAAYLGCNAASAARGSRFGGFFVTRENRSFPDCKDTATNLTDMLRFRTATQETTMSRESEWVEFVLRDDFPAEATFREGSRANHVIVEWEVVGADDAPRRSSPFVIVIDPEAIDRYEKSDPPEQARIKGRIREMVKHRRDDYDPDGRVDIAEAFVVQIDEGDL